MNERFQMPARLRNFSMGLIIVGIITLIAGFVALKGSHELIDQKRFWIVLLHNSVFFLLITVASVFIQAASSLAQGAWIVAYRRVPEAIGANVWVFGLLAMAVLFGIAFGFQDANGRNPIYAWMTDADPAIMKGHVDHIIAQKTAFLNPKMFVGFTVVTIGLWSLFGFLFRKFSIDQESAPVNNSKIYWKYVKFAGMFLLVYALTQMSTTPWVWIMSIAAHWYSTMFSWYTFASAFVSGMSLIMLWVVYLKKQDHMSWVSKEHLHDLGKFQFAFSIFWTYVWFAQYMLIWYGNIPEETTYFAMRQHGPYAVIWYSVFIINFVAPILILMSRPSKRNYFTVTFMGMIIIFGHWLDFYIMTMPEVMGSHFKLNWYELGIFAGFAGILMFAVGKSLGKYSLLPKNNVLLKEAILHQS